MTVDRLQERLNGNSEGLLGLTKLINEKRGTVSLPIDTLNLFDPYPGMAINLHDAAQLLDVRTAAHKVLLGILETADPNRNSVEFAGVETPFHAARLLAFQSVSVRQ